MKTLLLLLLSIPCFSQTTIHFYYSSEQTTGAEVLFENIGFGFSGAWDVKECLPGHINDYDRKQEVTSEIREEWCSIYFTASTGYFKNIMVKYRGGLAVYNDKVTFNNDYTKVECVTYRPLIGISAMYSFNDDYGIELGIDTFNKVTAGVTVKF